MTDASLSPIEKILYSNLLQRQSASPVRAQTPAPEQERAVAGTPYETVDSSGLDRSGHGPHKVPRSATAGGARRRLA